MNQCKTCNVGGGTHLENCPEAEFVLTRKVLRLARVGQTMRSMIGVEIEYDLDYGEMLHRLETYVLQEHLVDDEFTGYTTSTWPATTWQMFKHTHRGAWWLRWLVRKWPVVWTQDRQKVVINVARYNSYPGADVQPQGLGPAVPFEEITRVQ